LAGEYVERSDAVDAIRSLSPDLTFLDVRLRSATGFDVLADIDEHDLPVTIFTTAYDEYAVRAFEVHAVDYLLKPFDRDRFRIPMNRALAWTARHELPPSLRSLAAVLRASAPIGHIALSWIRARRPDQSSVIIETRDIHWIEAAGNYVYLHTSEGRFAHRQ